MVFVQVCTRGAARQSACYIHDVSLMKNVVRNPMRFERIARMCRSSLVALAVLAVACSGDPEKLKREYVTTADAYMAKGQVAEAIIEYRNAIQQDGRFGEARYKLALAYIEMNDGNRALDEAVRAADLLPDDVDAQIQAANLLIRAGRYADAQDRANAVLQRKPDDVRATVSLGNALAGLRDLDGAVAQLEAAIRLDPTRAGSYTNLATLQLGAGRLKEAETAYTEAVTKAPDSVPSRLALAQFYWLTSRPQPAEAELLIALQKEPGSVLANRFAAAFYQATGHADKAEQYFRAAVVADGSSRARLALAEYYIGQARLPEATETLKALVSDEKVGPTAAVRLATIDYAAGRGEAAATAIDAILKTQPRNVEALLVKASMLFDQNGLDEALARTNDAITADPSSAQAHFARGRVLAAQSRKEEAKEAFNAVLKINPRAAGAQLELSKLFLQAGAAANAVAYAGAAVTSDPRRADSRLVLARGLIVNGEYDKAEPLLRELVAALPESPTVHAQVGLLHLAKKEMPAAMTAFRRALELDPLELEAVHGIVAIDLSAGRREAALGRLRTLLEQAPNNAGLLAIAGGANLASANLDEAEKLLTRAIAADPNTLDAYSNLGQVHLRQRRIEDARRAFERRAEREERPVSSLTMVGLIFQMQKRTDEAQKTFERVVALDPKAAIAANNLAWIYAENGGNLDVAMQYAQTAYAATPDSAATADTLGWIYLKKELYPFAIKTLGRAVELDPKNPTLHYHLGLAYARSGDAGRARTTLETALRLQSDFDGAADASKVLAGL